MTRLMGPVLSFRGKEGAKWGVSAIVVTDGGAPTFEVAGLRAQQIQHTALWSVGTQTVHRFLFSVSAQSANFQYTVDNDSFEVALPGKESPRMAYASCNGFSDPKYMKLVDRKNKLWETMWEKHQEHPYHLLLLGGDQVYADPIWEVCAPIKAWNQLPSADGIAAPFTAKMAAEVERFYFELYVERWNQDEVRTMMSRVPSICMWDDHDIFDGWGSYPPDRQNCAVFQGIGRIAKKAFAVFQQHLTTDEIRPGSIAPDHGFTCGYSVGTIAILALDMRSERTEDRVLSLPHWNLVYEWIDSLKELDHLLVLSSIPVVYPGFDTLERLLGAIPGHQDLEDDLRDHWNSSPHKDERLRLIHRLLRFASTTHIRPALISGDVHVAAVGVIENERDPARPPVVINQLISSAIVHPGPNAVALFCLKYLFDSVDEVDRGIIARMTEFPGNKIKFIGKRNFLSLEPDDERRIWANWIVEGESHPTTKVIHAIETPTVTARTRRQPRRQ